MIDFVFRLTDVLYIYIYLDEWQKKGKPRSDAGELSLECACEIRFTIVNWEHLILSRINSNKPISLEDLTNLPARIWFSMYRGGKKRDDDRFW